MLEELGFYASKPANVSCFDRFQGLLWFNCSTLFNPLLAEYCKAKQSKQRNIEGKQTQAMATKQQKRGVNCKSFIQKGKNKKTNKPDESISKQTKGTIKVYKQLGKPMGKPQQLDLDTTNKGQKKKTQNLDN